MKTTTQCRRHFRQKHPQGGWSEKVLFLTCFPSNEVEKKTIRNQKVLACTICLVRKAAKGQINSSLQMLGYEWQTCTCTSSLSGSTKPQRTFPLFKGEKAELKLLCFRLLEIQNYAHLPSERDTSGRSQENCV